MADPLMRIISPQFLDIQTEPELLICFTSPYTKTRQIFQRILGLLLPSIFQIVPVNMLHEPHPIAPKQEFRAHKRHRCRRLYRIEESDSSDNDDEATLRTKQSFSRRMRKGLYKRAERSGLIADPEEWITSLLDSFDKITEETSQLIEVKEIIDELNMIYEVQEEQARVIEDFAKLLPDDRKKQKDQLNRIAATTKYQCSEIAALSTKAKGTLKAVWAYLNRFSRKGSSD